MTTMDEYKDIKDLLKRQRQIGASAHLRQRVSKALAQKRNTSTRWMWSGVAAACAAMIVGVIMFFNSKSSIAPSHNDNCIVYVAGQKASGDEAQAIAKADVARMQQFMQTVARQNAAEQEKVNQFMQHKFLEK